jgi:hypothetical protein
MFVKEGIMKKWSLTDDSIQSRACYVFSDVFVSATQIVSGLQKPGTQKEKKNETLILQTKLFHLQLLGLLTNQMVVSFEKACVLVKEKNYSFVFLYFIIF